MRDSLDPEDAERNEIMIGRIEELARQTESPLERLERMVHPWTSYLVLPLFARVNAGVALSAEFIRRSPIGRSHHESPGGVEHRAI